MDYVRLEINRRQAHSQSPAAYIRLNGEIVERNVHALADSAAGAPAIRVIYGCPDPPSAAMDAKFARLRQLAPGWNGYDAAPPSALAIQLAQVFVRQLNQEAYTPNRVAPSAVGGVGITQRADRRSVYVEFYNSGQILALYSDGETEPIIENIEPTNSSFGRLIKKMREYLNA